VVEDKKVSFIAPHVADLAAFVRRASLDAVMQEITNAVVRIDVIEDEEKRWQHAKDFLDDMPIVLNASYGRGYLEGFIKGCHRHDDETLQ
jgi:hypothetical protein